MKRYIAIFTFVLALLFSGVVYAQIGDSTGNNNVGVLSDTVISTEAVKDTILPTLNIIGLNPYYIPFGGKYIEPGAEAFDNIDGDISSLIEIINNIDTNVSGEYIVRYVVRDSAGNVEDGRRVVVVLNPETIATAETADEVNISTIEPSAKIERPSTVISLSSENGEVANSNVVSGELVLSVSTIGARNVIANIPQADSKDRIIELDKSETSDSIWIGEWDTRDVSDGEYIIIVFVTNEFGNYRAASVKIIIKNGNSIQTPVDVEHVKPVLEDIDTDIDEPIDDDITTPRSLRREIFQGCKTSAECLELCTKEDGQDECKEYVQEKIILDISTQVRSVVDYITPGQVEDVLKRNIGPGGCGGVEECSSYCSNPIHDNECGDFLRANNILSKEELDDSQELLNESRKNRIEVLRERIGARISLDSDEDGLTDYDEINIYGTDPQDVDTDGDGVPDGVELLSYTNPLVNQQGIKHVSTSVSEGLDGAEEEVLETDAIEYENPQDAWELDEEKFIIDTVTLETTTVEDITSESVVLSGKAPANSLVTLYVFSNTIIVSLKTNEDGSWEYTFTREIEDGTHEAYVALTDSNGKIFAKSNAFPFVKQAQAITVGEALLDTNETKAPSLVGASYTLTFILIFLLGAVFIFIGFRMEGKEENIS